MAARPIDWPAELYASWMGHLRGLDADALAAPCGPSEGPYAAYPFAALILHVTREVIHHGAEIALLRDLYRVRNGLRPRGE